MFESEIQANESYFGGALKGKLGQGEAGKTSYLFFETKWQSNTVVVMNMQSATLLPIIRENKQGSIIYMNFYRGYDILKLYLKEYEWRFNHSDLKNSNFYFKTINLGEF
ncbi:hypothetical protein CHBNV3_15800 [Haemophilus influenzae]|nr:insertion element IS1016 transposase [Haemophilus influenzae PittII]PRJ86388.1 hypothetical protein BV162_01138 [Haemophilus influenzae]PRK65593.1 hypothetical protein BV160_00473 [Haemophilus influenzae]PRK67791.1 hypothetical protein BV159_01231 [Haemophilus influenzae]BBF11132.1 hypothetical protein CHBNIV1_14930 [Haemophilus influenzae]